MLSHSHTTMRWTRGACLRAHWASGCAPYEGHLTSYTELYQSECRLFVCVWALEERAAQRQTKHQCPYRRSGQEVIHCPRPCRQQQRIHWEQGTPDGNKKGANSQCPQGLLIVYMAQQVGSLNAPEGRLLQGAYIHSWKRYTPRVQ